MVGCGRVQTQLGVRHERLLAHLWVGHGRSGLGKHASKPNLRMGVDQPDPTWVWAWLGAPSWAWTYLSPPWGWAWTPPGPTSGLPKTIRSFAKTQTPGDAWVWPKQGSGCPCAMWSSGLPRSHVAFGLP